jgi:hypothetical protein
MGKTGKSVYFGNYKSSREQWLLDSLVRESIDIYGESMYYCPRTLNNYNTTYGADDQSSYQRAILIPIYIENVKGFGGDGTFMSKFGIEIRDRMMFSISQSVFSEEVGNVTGQVRPNEGDLIYFPLNNKCFQIKYVEKFEMFYPLGALYTWKVDCELFEYSSERMETGIPEIDSLDQRFSMDVTDFGLRTETGQVITDEDGKIIMSEKGGVHRVAADDSAEIEEESSEFIDFSVADPFSEGNIGTPKVS